VKQEIQSAMSCRGWWDRRTVSARIPCAPFSLFIYLKDELEAAIGHTDFVQSARFTRMKKIVYDILSVNKRQLKVNGHLVCILYEDKLLAVRKLFGTSFAVAITNPVPSIKMLQENPSMKPTVLLRNSEVMRMITCSNHDDAIDGGI
jgi:hypothetical protein